MRRRRFRKGDRVRLTRSTQRRAKSFYNTSSHKGHTGPAEVIDYLGDDILVIEFDRSGGIGIHRHADLEPA